MSQELLSALVTAALFTLFLVWVPLLRTLERFAHHFLFHQPPRVLAWPEPGRGGSAQPSHFVKRPLGQSAALGGDPALARSAKP